MTRAQRPELPKASASQAAWAELDEGAPLEVGASAAPLNFDGARQRIFLSYAAARAALASALVLGHAVLEMVDTRLGGIFLGLTLLYALQALLWWFWPGSSGNKAELSRRNWWWTVGIDVLAFSSLHALDRTGLLNYGALLVLPLLITGALASRRTALAMASGMALMLLLVALLRALETGAFPSLVPQAGLAGMGLLLIALVAGQMAAWLARDEQLARGSMELAQQQAELNRLVIEEMTDGVLVVDSRAFVRAANPAARQLLSEEGDCPPAPFPLALQPGWAPLREAVAEAFVRAEWPAAGRDITIQVADDSPRALRVRARFTRHGGEQATELLAAPEQADADSTTRGEPLAVLFIEALRDVQARQRQERLVAMGRISAGIAHEIRNPLAAISQANALLQEDDLPPDHQRLVRIMGDNVMRLKRLVDDVMEASPGGGQVPVRLEAVEQVKAMWLDWLGTADVSRQSGEWLDLRLPAGPLWVWFEPEHLRRVLVNLLDNALRHCATLPGSVILALEPQADGMVRLSVANDGDAMALETEKHLFEPFHSTRSRGTGLGLYICRELCVRHGASIDYLRQSGSRHANLFCVLMRAAEAPAATEDLTHHA